MGAIVLHVDDGLPVLSPFLSLTSFLGTQEEEGEEEEEEEE